MIVEFTCACDNKSEVYYSSIDKYKEPTCIVCNRIMQRVWSPITIKIGSNKVPNGIIELGNECPRAPKKEDNMKNVEKEIHEYLNSNTDLELSKLHE